MSTVAKLALEDGNVYTGASFGAKGEVDGEVCFNTSMTGYQEILTDPSYRGQIVTMTYPHIGNYGVNDEDFLITGHRSIKANLAVCACLVRTAFACETKKRDLVRRNQDPLMC